MVIAAHSAGAACNARAALARLARDIGVPARWAAQVQEAVDADRAKHDQYRADGRCSL